MYNDPVVVLHSAKTYERWAILEHWRRKGGPHDPLSNLHLEAATIMTDWSKRHEVAAFLARHDGYIPDGWHSRNLQAPREHDQWQDSKKHGARNVKAVPRLLRLWFLVLITALLGYRFKVFFRLPFLVSLLLVGQLTGNVDIVVRVMREYPESFLAQGRACYLLAEYADITLAHAGYLIQAGSADLIAAALGNHQHKRYVQVCGCSAVANLATSRQHVSVLTDAGVLPLLIAAMANHPRSKQVQHAACMSLVNMAGFTNETRLALLQGGAIARIISALDLHPDVASVQFACCWALEQLLKDAAVELLQGLTTCPQSLKPGALRLPLKLLTLSEEA